MKPIFKYSFLFIGIIIVSLVIYSTYLSKDSKEETGQLSETQYCKKYIEFDRKVPTASETEQYEMLQSIHDTPDFPQELKQAYETIITGYENFFADQDITQDEEKNHQAFSVISIHARDNCGLYETNN